ncbi:hypothetical protein AB1L30_20525 [Bremerella sp. JC817]|uniref:hypothetical protein n=1 Tax=Bremerella sp. JC817 TaxID=3231756 RepID=UPI00345A12AD
MSTRTELVSLPSMQPLQAAVASGDEDLADQLKRLIQDDLAALYGEDDVDAEEHDEFQAMVQEMILSKSPPSEEPGTWQALIRRLAVVWKLDVKSDYSFNQRGWHHYGCWGPYRKMLTGCITVDSLKLLEYLDLGRPLRGDTVEDDGCLFAWLDPDEVIRLEEELSSLEESAIVIEELQDFHELLTECLDEVAQQQHALLLLAN